MNIERFVCASCYKEIKIPADELIHSEFKRKFDEKKFVSGFSSAFLFEKDGVIQSMIHSLKYNQNFLLGIYLGKLTAIELRPLLLSWNADVLSPVPLHSLKKAERGYNQSYYIAKGISKTTGTIVNHHLVKRTRFTQSQTTMNLKEREENMSGAFSCKDKKEIQGKKIILIDDVITTGSTINEVAGELIKAGAEKVYALSAAIADI
jgi:ComF family protein